MSETLFLWREQLNDTEKDEVVKLKKLQAEGFNRASEEGVKLLVGDINRFGFIRPQLTLFLLQSFLKEEHYKRYLEGQEWFDTPEDSRTRTKYAYWGRR